MTDRLIKSNALKNEVVGQLIKKVSAGQVR